MHLFHTIFSTKFIKRNGMKKLTLELVESRLQELSKEHKLDIMDEKLLVLYCKKYGSLTNEIADILCPRYGLHGIYPTPKNKSRIE